MIPPIRPGGKPLQIGGKFSVALVMPPLANVERNEVIPASDVALLDPICLTSSRQGQHRQRRVLGAHFRVDCRLRGHPVPRQHHRRRAGGGDHGIHDHRQLNFLRPLLRQGLTATRVLHEECGKDLTFKWQPIGLNLMVFLVSALGLEPRTP